MFHKYSFFIVCLVLLTIIVPGLAGAWLYHEFSSPGPLKNEYIIYIEPGSSVSVIAKNLEINGVIENSFLFKLGIKLFAKSSSLKAGEYLLPDKVSSKEVVKILQSAKTILRSVTIIEGQSSLSIIKKIRKTFGLTGLVEKVPDEGTLLPETYFYSYGDSRQSLIDRMQESMKKLFCYINC